MRPSDPNSRAESSAKQVWTQASRGHVARRAHPCPEKLSQVCRREGKAWGPKSCEWRKEVSLTGCRDSDPRAKWGLGVTWVYRLGGCRKKGTCTQPGSLGQSRSERSRAQLEMSLSRWGLQIPTSGALGREEVCGQSC